MEEYTRKQRIASRPASREMNISSEMAGKIPNSAMEAVMAGKARASSEMMGHRQDLAPSMKAKMTKAFGMDLNGMQIYRSEAMSGTGTEGLASGNRIVLSTDIDLNTIAGQAVLGHELSHIRAQRAGIGAGHSGLWENAALEHQADTEGMMAARGLSAEGSSFGMATSEGMGGISSLTPLGPGMSASAGAPMQAKKGKKIGGAILGGAGRALGTVSGIANIVTGGQLFGSLYNKTLKSKGVGSKIARAALFLPAMITNLPSTILGGISQKMTQKGMDLYNEDNFKNNWRPSMAPESSDEKRGIKGPELEYNDREESLQRNIPVLDLLAAGGTRFANRNFNPGLDSREDWIKEKVKKRVTLNKTDSRSKADVAQAEEDDEIDPELLGDMENENVDKETIAKFFSEDEEK